MSDWINNVCPSHKCTVCGALWRLFRKEDNAGVGDSWSLCSNHCGKCCDNAAMGEQIVPVTLNDIGQFITAKIAVDAMNKVMGGNTKKH